MPPEPDISAIIRDEDLRMRVREVLGGPGASSRLLHFLRHPLTGLIVGFLLTAGAGTFITHYYQAHEEDAKLRSELREARRSDATKLFEEVGRLADARYFALGRFHQAVDRKYSDREQRLRDSSYAAITEEWGQTFRTRYALVCRYFGVNAARALKEIDAHFDSARNQWKEDAALGYPEQAKLNDELYGYSLELAQLLRTNRLVEDDAVGNDCEKERAPTME
jgi:hypothetical protein